MPNRFKEGDAVRVKFEIRPGHIRTPMYVRGKTGIIAAYYGSFPNPEKLAYGGDGLPPVPLYGVRFELSQLWSDPSLKDTLQMDIYEHWLEPA
ncbi:MAG: nitrile hydratase subunit beta [Deltaproteobacteria bacterium]|nr:nitrile hydratase subunit beta [Deltaproteobacteria bacterium]